MKKILFLQIKGKSFGGVWQVNKTIGEELLKQNYQVSIVSLRNNKNNLKLEHDKKLEVFTINEIDNWGTHEGKDIINSFKKLKIMKGLTLVLERIKYQNKLKKDIKKLQKYIEKLNPDYIITTHYQLIGMIQKKYLKRVLHEQHSSLKDAMNHKATKKTLFKYKDKIKYIWLTKSTMEEAINYGLENSYYIYNAVRFKSDTTADVIKNKKIITIARLSKDKSLDKMIDIAKEIFKDKKLSQWILEIYGSGEEEEYIKNKINNHKQIKLMGLTNDPKKELLSASINLNTSKYEGFALSILEANECGIPTVTFNFGESVEEEIINGKTGIIAKDKEDYINKLKQLMTNEQQLLELSKNCKQFNQNFQIEKIIKEWIKLFKEIDESNE